MHSSQARAIGHAQEETARPQVWERRLQRFPKPYQHRVRAVANAHPRLRDLALSFPALLFAIAVPRAGVDPTAVAAGVVAGERLQVSAKLASLPMWLRLLPPEAFAAPIPPLPDSDAFRKQIVNHIPKSPKVLPDWLNAIGSAFAFADECHAIWFAREFARGPKAWKPKRRRRRRVRPILTYTSLRRLCLWAWYSTKVPTNVRRADAWSPAMHLCAAEAAADRWLQDIDLQLHLNHEVRDMWFLPATIDGFEFVALSTPDDIAEEAIAMQNCLRSYGPQIADDTSRLWSVRRMGERVATLELAMQGGDPVPNIYELKGRANATVGVDVSFAARRWMAGNEDALRARPWTAQRVDRSAALQDAAWRAQWRPYWLTKRRIPGWLPLKPTPYAIWNI
jgi:hypothetical protein